MKLSLLILGCIILCSSLTTAQLIPFAFWNKKNSQLTICTGSTWTQAQYFKAPNPGIDDEFGYSVAVWGDTVVIGAPKEDSNTEGVATSTSGSNNDRPNTGAVYVFTKNSSGIWSLQAYIKPTNGDNGDNFGHRVSLYENTLAISAPFEDSDTSLINGTGTSTNDTASAAGAVYIYKRTGTTWAQEAFIKPDHRRAGSNFGERLHLDKDQLIASAKYDDSDSNNINHWPTGADTGTSANDAGAAFLFTRTGTTWSQSVYFKADNSDGSSQNGGGPTDKGDTYGDDSYIDNNTVVVGAINEQSTTTGVSANASAANNSGFRNGALYIYTKNISTGIWSQQAYIKSDDNDDHDSFGNEVIIKGDTLVVSAHLEDSNQTTVTTSTSSNNSSSASGAVYVYNRSGTTWSLSHFIKPPNTDNGDRFSQRIALVGDRILATAGRERSNQQSITNGTTASSNDSNADAGAAYIFKKTGATWQQEAYIKPDNSGADDLFGEEQADFKGHQVIIGAIGEDSNQSTLSVTGSGNNSLSNSGAAYLFECN